MKPTDIQSTSASQSISSKLHTRDYDFSLRPSEVKSHLNLKVR